MHALKDEILTEAPKYKDYEVQTVFIGGGTPTAVEAVLLCDLIKTLKLFYRVAKDAEISMEANPGTVKREALLQYHLCGINRLSIGLQSADNKELALLGRIHTYEDFLATYHMAVETGFTNLNLDLMSALPGQTPQAYKETLKKVLSLNPLPTHLSAYSLIIEEGTPFYKRYGEERDEMERTGDKQEHLPSEEEERAMYRLTEEMLAQAGYHRYEISNYSLPQFACRHNLVYWQRGNYVGFGLGAASMVENVRFKNTDDLTEYLKKPDKIAEKRALTKTEQMEEFLFLGLRLIKGVSKNAFEKYFGVTMDSIYGEVIKENVRKGLLKDGEYVALTEQGLDVSNYVMAQFLLS